jgi:MOSC domain-containing protein YiiM
MARHLTLDELQAGLPHILASPKDEGRLEAIVIRPESGVREELGSCEISLARGTHGDRWIKGSHMLTEEGEPHPDVQICIMNARCIGIVSPERERWKLAGDNLFLDLDLSPENLPPGRRLAIGTAVIEITDAPHAPCKSFMARYGPDAVRFLASPEGRARRLRGIYARVVQDGRVTVGDRAVKLD